MIPPDVIITTLVGTPYRIGVRPTNLTMHETVFTVTWQAVLPDLVLTYTESPVADSSMGVGGRLCVGGGGSTTADVGAGGEAINTVLVVTGVLPRS